jgi:hypothetical protein
VPILLGRVDRVGFITLLGCRPWGARYGAGTTGSYRINHLLAGVHLNGPAERFVRRVELEIPSLALVFGDRPVEFGRVPTSRTRTMQVKVDPRRLVWKDDEVTIEFQYIWNVRHGELGLDITMSPQVYLSSRVSQSFDWWFTQWLVPLSQLIQVTSGELFRARRGLVSRFRAPSDCPEDLGNDVCCRHGGRPLGDLGSSGSGGGVRRHESERDAVGVCGVQRRLQLRDHVQAHARRAQ